MVRLKAAVSDEAYSEKITISIPYGAIKRVLAFLDNRQNLYFNSLWCD